MIYSSTPFIAACLSYLLLKERLTIGKFIGVCIGLCGMVPIFMVSSAHGLQDAIKITLPDIVLFGAVVSGAYAWFLVKQLLVKGYPLTVINGMAMLIGGLLSFITAFLCETPPFVYDWPQFLLWVAALIIVSNVILYNFYGWLLHYYSITFLTFAGFLSPTFAAFYDWAFFGGQIHYEYLVSLVFVTIGLYVFYRQELFNVKKS